jgi:hypothetical protein
MESIDVFLVEPPREWVSDDGIVMRTVAEYINDDHERVDLGIVAIGPTKTGRAVLGFVGKETIFKENFPAEKPRRFRKSATERVKRAEEEAASTILNHLGLIKLK